MLKTIPLGRWVSFSCTYTSHSPTNSTLGLGRSNWVGDYTDMGAYSRLRDRFMHSYYICAYSFDCEGVYPNKSHRHLEFADQNRGWALAWRWALTRDTVVLLILWYNSCSREPTGLVSLTSAQGRFRFSARTMRGTSRVKPSLLLVGWTHVSRTPFAVYSGV